MIKNLLLWFEIFLHVIYRVIQILVDWLQQKIFSLPSGKGELLKVVYRRRIVEADGPRGCDFIGLHQKFVDPGEFLQQNDNWCLYAVSKQHVYIVVLRRPFKEYRATKVPFVHVAFYHEATKILRIKLEDFCEMTEEIWENQGKGMVFLAMSPRSGTTVLATMLDAASDSSYCFSEIGIYGVLGIAFVDHWWNQEKFQRILKSVIRATIALKKEGEVFIFKTQSKAAVISSQIRNAAPEAKTLFQSRRNILASHRSMVKMSYNPLEVTKWAELVLYPKLIPVPTVFIRWTFAKILFFSDQLAKAGATNMTEYFFIRHFGPNVFYFNNREDFDAPVIFYEDLIAEPGKKLSEILTACEITGVNMERAVEQSKRNPQGGTFGDSNWGKEANLDFGPEWPKRIREMVGRLEIPLDEFILPE